MSQLGSNAPCAYIFSNYRGRQRTAGSRTKKQRTPKAGSAEGHLLGIDGGVELVCQTVDAVGEGDLEAVSIAATEKK